VEIKRREKRPLIDFIKGTLQESGAGWVVVENHGIGYRLEVPGNLTGSGWQEGKEVLLYSRLVLKEDGLYLYGFGSSEERNLFNLVLGVSGFGPRLALSVLSKFTVSQFYVSVLEENVKSLSRIPGVGKKTAQRLILELKEKLPSSFSGEEAEIPVSAEKTNEKETIEALSALGFSLEEAASAVKQAGAQSDNHEEPEGLLKAALKLLSQS